MKLLKFWKPLRLNKNDSHFDAEANKKSIPWDACHKWKAGGLIGEAVLLGQAVEMRKFWGQVFIYLKGWGFAEVLFSYIFNATQQIFTNFQDFGCIAISKPQKAKDSSTILPN